MREGVIVRAETGPAGTFGRLVLEGGWSCVTAEPPWKNNRNDVSCIPCGVYELFYDQAIYGSSRLKRPVYRFREVPGRTGILIHVGNWAGDVEDGYESDVQGCVLVGAQVGPVAFPASRELRHEANRGKRQRGVNSSADTFASLLSHTGLDAIRLRIVSACGEPFQVV